MNIASPTRHLFLTLLITVAIAPACNAAALPGQKYALLVGVRNYGQSSQLRKLQYTENDIEDLADVLRDKGFRKENVMTMTQTRGAEELRFLPIGRNIRRELQLLIRDLQKQDTLLIAFSGHGLQFSGESVSYFCPLDARIDDRESLIALQDVYSELKKCKAQFKLLLCDACRNDPVKQQSKRATIDLESQTRPQDVSPPGGSAAFFSCSAGEASFEHDDLKHGVFFHNVIEGLRGKADLDQDSQVTLPEMEYFVKRRVSDYVRANFDGARQRPQLVGTQNGLFSILGEIDEVADLPDEISGKKPLVNSLGMKLIRVSGATFPMGAPETDQHAQDDERPRHTVTVSRTFSIGATEVSVGQFRKFVEDTGRTFGPGYGIDPLKGKFVRNAKFDWQKTGFAQSEKHPVTNVGWTDAVAFCEWLSQREGQTYRLPTEAEWELACRAGTTTVYSTGDAADSVIKAANLAEQSFASTFGVKANLTHTDGFPMTAPVGSFEANAFGLHDMHGNVWEWCSDVYQADYYQSSPKTDPSGPARGELRAVRGGSWAGGPFHARSSDRSGYGEDERNLMIGFRVVMED